MTSLTYKVIKKRPTKDKIVVITGASSGVGRAAALEFAAHGAKLILAARRDHTLQEVVEECEALGGNAIAVHADVAEPHAMKNLAEAAFKFGGRIDVWINNAGVLAAGSFTETPVDIHDRVIDVNLKGYLHGAYSVLPYFKQQKYGVLINNISVGGWIPTPYAAAYTASKFGLRGLSEALRGELIGWRNIHVCDLYPAFLDTPGIQHAANYTNVVLKPAPPVYDPKLVAKAMLWLSGNPRSSTTTDLVAPSLKLSYNLFPKIFLFATASLMRGYFKKAAPITSTTGNVFAPVNYGTSIDGGWQSVSVKPKNAIKGVVLLAGLAFLIARLASKK